MPSASPGPRPTATGPTPRLSCTRRWKTPKIAEKIGPGLRQSDCNSRTVLRLECQGVIPMAASPTIDQIFAEALACAPGPDRTAYLDRVCGDDEPLRKRLERLLRAHGAAESFL